MPDHREEALRHLRLASVALAAKRPSVAAAGPRLPVPGLALPKGARLVQLATLKR